MSTEVCSSKLGEQGPSGLKRKRVNDSSDSEDPVPCKMKYFYMLAPETEISSNSETESYHSIQDKSTDLPKTTSDTCTKSSWTSGEDSRDMVEFEVVSVSDSEKFYNFGQTKESSSAPEDVKPIYVSTPKVEKRKSGGEKSIDEISTDSDNETFQRWIFRTCLWCNQSNTNPYFRFCSKCFKLRKSFLPPRPKKRSRSKGVLSKESDKKYDNGDSGIGSSQSQDLCSKDLIDATDLCQICMTRPRDGGFCHGNIIHVYACYKCSVKTFKQSGRCPVCNIKTRQIFKVISV